VLTSTIESSFEMLFLAPTPTSSQIAEAHRVLASVDGRSFTAAAISVLARSGPKPSRLPTTGSMMWFRRDLSRGVGWHFLVAIPGEHTSRQIEWWLTNTGAWLVSDQSLQGSAFQTTNTQPLDFTRARVEQLVSSRMSRVSTWLHEPGGRLNAGVE
jgi:hypothetical protein